MGCCGGKESAANGGRANKPTNAPVEPPAMSSVDCDLQARIAERDRLEARRREQERQNIRANGGFISHRDEGNGATSPPAREDIPVIELRVAPPGHAKVATAIHAHQQQQQRPQPPPMAVLQSSTAHNNEKDDGESVFSDVCDESPQPVTNPRAAPPPPPSPPVAANILDSDDYSEEEDEAAPPPPQLLVRQQGTMSKHVEATPERHISVVSDGKDDDLRGPSTARIEEVPLHLAKPKDVYGHALDEESDGESPRTPENATMAFQRTTHPPPPPPPPPVHGEQSGKDEVAVGRGTRERTDSEDVVLDATADTNPETDGEEERNGMHEGGAQVAAPEEPSPLAQILRSELDDKRALHHPREPEREVELTSTSEGLEEENVKHVGKAEKANEDISLTSTSSVVDNTGSGFKDEEEEGSDKGKEEHPKPTLSSLAERYRIDDDDDEKPQPVTIEAAAHVVISTGVANAYSDAGDDDAITDDVVKPLSNVLAMSSAMHEDERGGNGDVKGVLDALLGGGGGEGSHPGGGALQTPVSSVGDGGGAGLAPPVPSPAETENRVNNNSIDELLSAYDRCRMMGMPLSNKDHDAVDTPPPRRPPPPPMMSPPLAGNEDDDEHDMEATSNSFQT